MFNPLISVVVPIYCVEQYLVRCINSIIGQSYSHLEIILVNDGSPDGCKEICDDFAKRHEQVTVVHQENKGLVHARKAGLVIATGDYVAYVDGDDWIEEDLYEQLVEYVHKFNPDIVVAGHKEELMGRVVEECDNLIPSGYYDETRLKSEVYPRMICFGEFSSFGIYSYLWNKLFRRDILVDAQMTVPDEIFMAEDAACSYPAILHAKSIYVCQVKGYRYVQRVNSMVKSRMVNSTELLRYNELYRYLFNCFRDSPLDYGLLAQLNKFVLSLLTVRSEMCISEGEESGELTAFDRIPQGSRIVLCGAGTFGQYLATVLNASASYELVSWVDDSHGLYRDAGLNVSSFTEMNFISFDIVVVALIRADLATAMARRLLDFNVNKSQVFTVSHFRRHPVSSSLLKYGVTPLSC